MMRDAKVTQIYEATNEIQQVPDFFIVGHQKSGTTALYFMLRSHPQIFMPDVKEPKFFAADLRTKLGAKLPQAARLHTLEGYLELFAPAREDQLVGEASPQYLRSRVAAGAIAELCPDAKIVAILREPSEFVRSLHQQMLSSNVESERDLRRAMELEPDRAQGRRIPRGCHHPESLLYSQHVRYTEQLERFHAAFGRERVLVLIYDDFRADNEATLRQVLRFLEVDERVPVPGVETKPVKEARSLPLHRLAGAMRVARNTPEAAGPAARALNALVPRQLRSEGARAAFRRLLYRAPKEPDAAFMAELRARFEPEVHAVSEYLERDLVALWGYNQLAEHRS